MHRDRLVSAAVAGGAALLFVALAWGLAHTSKAARVDDGLTSAVLDLLPVPLRRGLDQLARPLIIVALAPLGVVLALLAAVRLAFRRLVAAVIIAVASPVLALGHPMRGLLDLSDDHYPSDHAAMAFALLVAVVLLWPSPLGRRGLLVAAAVGAATALGNVTWYAHHVGDVAGSALLVTAVAGAAFTVTGSAAANVGLAGRE